MGQSPRRRLIPHVFFSRDVREQIYEALDALKRASGRKGNPWLAEQILARLPKRAVSNRESFRKAVHRFMDDPIGVRDNTVAKVHSFAAALPTPVISMPPAVGKHMRVELAVNDRAEAIIFHSQPFPYDLSWLKFNLDSSRLSFVMQDGAYSDSGFTVQPNLARHMQKAVQVLMVLTDEKNGEPIEGGYIPLIKRQKGIASNQSASESTAPEPEQSSWITKDLVVGADWRSLLGAKLDAFLRTLSEFEVEYKFAKGTTRVIWRSMPFYRNTILIRTRNSVWRKKHLSVFHLQHDQTLYRLAGSSSPIYEANSKAELNLTSDTVIEYLRFFCYFIRGDKGPFLLVDSIDDLNLPAKFDKARKAAIEAKLSGPVHEGFDDDGRFLCTGSVFYSNALFVAHFAVDRGGQVEMLADESIAENLPVSVNAPIV